MAIITTALLILVAYITSVAVYRLYFSPLAKFPGPKLAAISKWYEAYYEIVKKGQFTFKIDELHARYGENSNATIPSVSECKAADTKRRTDSPHHASRAAYQGQLVLGYALCSKSQSQ